MQGYFEAPIHLSKVGTAVVDGSGKLIESNQRFCSLMHAPQDAGSLEDCIDYGANPALGKGMEVLSRSACLTSVSMELKVANPDQENPLSATLSRLPDQAGEQEARYLMMIEETLQPERGGDIQQAHVQRAIRARFDHDLRSRLNVILGYCSMMIEDLADKDGADEMVADLKCIATAGNELLSLNGKTSDLLALIQGSRDVESEEILPANIIADTVTKIRPRFPEHRFWVDADDATVCTDAEILSKLVSSLIFRLCQELSSGCKIRITAGHETDTGSYQIVIACTPAARSASDRKKLQNSIGQLRERAQSDSGVPNLDLFYVDTLCETLGARVEANFDQDNRQGSYRIELPARTDNE